MRGCGGAFECVCVRVSCVGEGAQSPSLSVPCAGDSVSISVTMGGSLPDDVSTSPIGCDFEGLLIVKTWRWSGQDAAVSAGVTSRVLVSREECRVREGRWRCGRRAREGTISVILCCTESAAAVGVEAASSKA